MPDVLLHNLLILLTNCSRPGCNFELASLSDWHVDQARNVFFMNIPPSVAIPTNGHELSRSEGSVPTVEKSMAEICKILCRIAELTRPRRIASHYAGCAHYHEKKILVKKKRTAEEILADMEAATGRFDAQNKFLQDCQNEIRTLKAAREAIRHELKTLATQARSIKSVRARQEADQPVRNMKLFIDQFTGDTGSDRYSNRPHPQKALISWTA
ncbi:hypothetical protein BV898_19356 [Hypsibius exemplaris]|uniref:Uncharacterized protein n=1 Tax=Hypsibius exemplaris TaxID=2072580 RepID=A0A9X6NS20_HYPEX|nr:hypothetical protein BV898_19356 [Hypsibius exemplaris]